MTEMTKSHLVLLAAFTAASGTKIENNRETKLQTYFYWGVAIGKGAQIRFVNSDLSTYFGTTNPGNVCAGAEIFRCVVGFNVNQVHYQNGVTQLITFAGVLEQTRQITADRRPSL